jgi:histidine triad (HIT) family protein
VERGHTLVIPKQEVDYIFDLDPQTLSDLFLFSQRVARAIEATVPCKRIGIAVIGLEVPHAHVHLVPLIRQNFIDFSDKIEISKAELAELANQISLKFDV